MSALTIPKPKADPNCPYCRGIGYLRLKDLEPDDPHFGEPVRCVCLERAYKEYHYRRHLQKSQLKGWLKTASFDGFTVLKKTRPIMEAVQAISDRGTGWLTLWGGYGNGKTHLLAAAVNRNIELERTGAYFTLPDLLDKIRLSYEDEDYEGIMDFVSRVEMLALDEVDKVKSTAWAVEKIYQIVEDRYLNMGEKATLFAMNEAPTRKLKESSKLDYLFSRMNDSRCQVFEINAGDMRTMAHKLGGETNGMRK